MSLITTQISHRDVSILGKLPRDDLQILRNPVGELQWPIEQRLT